MKKSLLFIIVMIMSVIVAILLVILVFVMVFNSSYKKENNKFANLLNPFLLKTSMLSLENKLYCFFIKFI